MSKSSTQRGWGNDRVVNNASYGPRAKEPKQVDTGSIDRMFTYNGVDAQKMMTVIEAAFNLKRPIMFSRIYGGTAVRVKIFGDDGGFVADAYDYDELNRALDAIEVLLDELKG